MSMTIVWNLTSDVRLARAVELELPDDASCAMTTATSAAETECSVTSDATERKAEPVGLYANLTGLPRFTVGQKCRLRKDFKSVKGHKGGWESVHHDCSCMIPCLRVLPKSTVRG